MTGRFSVAIVVERVSNEICFAERFAMIGGDDDDRCFEKMPRAKIREERFQHAIRVAYRGGVPRPVDAHLISMKVERGRPAPAVEQLENALDGNTQFSIFHTG